VPAAVGIGVGMLYFGCVIARLRRYTVNALDHTAQQRTSFQGLPSPVAAMSVAASTMTAAGGPASLAWLPIAFAVISAPLMLSRVPYQETPRVAAWAVRAIWPLPVLAAIAWAAGSVPAALSVLFAAYVASGVTAK
jgi:phosphatidylserine synthase